MNQIVYFCENPKIAQLVMARNIPAIGDIILLPFNDDKSTTGKFKVVSRFINHTGKTHNTLEPDVYCIGLECA